MTKKISELIQPHFLEALKAPQPFKVFDGGRFSFKTSHISMYICLKTLKWVNEGKHVSVVIVRENAEYNRDSTHAQVVDTLTKLGAIDDFTVRYAPLTIIHKETKSTFYFYGLDKPDKLKSNAVKDVAFLWFEEAANIREGDKFSKTWNTFKRNKPDWLGETTTFFSYNPPRNPKDRFLKWLDIWKKSDDWLFHHSDYTQDSLGWLPESVVADAERLKQLDYQGWQWEYAGLPVGYSSNVYPASYFVKVAELPDNEKIVGLSFATDAGHMRSATTTLAIGFGSRGNQYLLDTYYYNPSNASVKKSPQEIAREIKIFVDKVADRYQAPVFIETIDSAEGAIRNQYFADYRRRMHPVAKRKNQDMIDYVSSYLSRQSFFILDTRSNGVFYEEHVGYMYDEKTLDTAEPKVVKEDDHTVDAFKYFVIDNRERLGMSK